jgi:hypothetical protein
MADDDRDDTQDDSEPINAARRRLLRNAVYVPPVIIGIVSLTQGCAPGSCSPSTCVPMNQCRPNQGCRPNPSDARLKRDIAPIRGALDRLQSL